LAAISVPNFLEAQVRSKVSRVKADERSLATAIESYYVNTGFYPTQLDVLWQGPVKYMSSPFADPYGSGGGSGSGYGAASSYRYLSGSEAYEKAARAGLVPPGKTAEANPNFWMAYSVGPDGRDDGGEVIYDPTNGSTSAGDIIRIGENESNEAYERPVPPSQNQLSQAYQRAAQTSSNVPEAGVEAAPLDADQKKLQESLGNSFTPEQIKIIQELIQAKLRDNNPAESPAAASPALANRVVDLEKQLRTLGVDVGKVNEQLDKFTDERETEARTRVNVAQLFREANTLSQVKKYDEAIIKIREILNLDSNNQLALQRLRVLEDMAAGKTTMDNLNEKRDSEIQQQYEQLKADALRNENRNTLASLTAAKVTWQMIKSMKIDYVEEATRMIALLDRKIERLAGKPAKIGGQDGGMQPLMKAGIGREEMMKQSGASRNLNMSPAPSVLDESNPQGVVTFYASDGATHGLGQSVVVYTANDSSDSLSGGMENLFEFDFSADANKRVGHSLSAGGDYIVGDLEEGAKNNVFGSSDALRFDEIVADDNSPDSGIIWSYDNAGLYRIGKTSRLGRKAGLLSLGIELPEGGVQRIFEGLTGDARVEVRLMAEKRFLRLAFIVWMGVFLGLGWVWFRRRERYRPALLAAILVSLLTPLIVENSYAAFFNAAFQGAVLSLILPLAFRLKRRVVPSGGSTAAAALMFAILAGLPSRVRGESTTADVNEPMEKRPPVRILVPYGDDIPTSPVLRLQSNDGPTTSPMAFISRDDFGRLWNAAHPISARLPGPGGAIQSLYLEGDLSPETASIKGTLLIRAANPDDRPTSVALRMEGLKIDSAPAGEIAPNNPLPAGTGLIYAEDGLRLSLAPQWSGELKASFNLPCRMNGASGSFSLQFPEVATGLWRVT
ncbi:hypothetical protein HYR69_05170, partial [Candidatus Sumerlaeota bacterium]|nr:hypothetical protein [Candidatus Sumerlaeota bacterium]